MTPTARDWRSPQAAVAGEVVLPDAPGYERAAARDRQRPGRPPASSGARRPPTSRRRSASRARTASRSRRGAVGTASPGAPRRASSSTSARCARCPSRRTGSPRSAPARGLGDVYDALDAHGLTIADRGRVRAHGRHRGARARRRARPARPHVRPHVRRPPRRAGRPGRRAGRARGRAGQRACVQPLGALRRHDPGGRTAALPDNPARGRTRGETRQLDFTPMGANYNRVAPDATAFPHREARFLLEHAVVARGAPADERRQALGRLERSWGLPRRWGLGGVYANFPDPLLGDDEWPRAYHGADHERLVAVRSATTPRTSSTARIPSAPGESRAADRVGLRATWSSPRTPGRRSTP
jgi:hypothetical protein